MTLVNPLALVPYSEEEQLARQRQQPTLLEPQAYGGQPTSIQSEPQTVEHTNPVIPEAVASSGAKPGMFGKIGRIAGTAVNVLGHPLAQTALFLGAPLLIDKLSNMGGQGQGQPQMSPELQRLQQVAGVTPEDSYAAQNARVAMELNKIRGFGYY